MSISANLGACTVHWPSACGKFCCDASTGRTTIYIESHTFICTISQTTVYQFEQIFSRRYFFSGALLAFAIVSSYAWAQFPYDNICLPDNPTSGFAETYDNVMILNGTVTSITVSEDEGFRFCNQHWRAYSGIAFPASPRWQENGLNWMTPDQETLTTLYGWTSLVVLIVFILAVFGGTMVRYALSWIHGMYSVSKKTCGSLYCDVAHR